MTKYPIQGRTKTRMIPLLGTKGAADLQYHMTQHVVTKVTKVRVLQNVDIVVYYTNDTAESSMVEWLGHNVRYKKQIDGTLGEKLTWAVADAVEVDNGSLVRTVIIGSDSPDISETTLTEAFNELESNDCVVGPAFDGGYYLIGFNSRAIQKKWYRAFQDIEWSTERVFDQTLTRFTENDITFGVLERMSDVDLPEDISVWHNALLNEKQINDSSLISIIIPVLNEKDSILTTLDSCYNNGLARNVEVIVVDGGSSDTTPHIVNKAVEDNRYQDMPVKVITMESKGKAYQMNLGAENAQGTILLFLHGDVLLPERYDSIARTFVQHFPRSVGAFRFKLDNNITGPSVDLMQRCTNWRAFDFSFPYGDQALFISASAFHGFPTMPFMEDYEYIKNMRARDRVKIVHEDVIVSSRRWAALGLWRTVVKNQIFVFLYNMGVAPETIRLWYDLRHN
jgi:hypothetical protein